MNIGTSIEGRKAVLAPAGKLTVQASPALSAAVEALPRTVCDIDIDVSNVDYISSAGLRALVAASKLATQRGGRLRLLHPQDNVYDVFDMTGLVNVLDIVR